MKKCVRGKKRIFCWLFEKDKQKFKKTQEEVIVFMTLIIILTQKLNSRLRRKEEKWGKGGIMNEEVCWLIFLSHFLYKLLSLIKKSSALNAAATHFYCASSNNLRNIKLSFCPFSSIFASDKRGSDKKNFFNFPHKKCTS